MRNFLFVLAFIFLLSCSKSKNDNPGSRDPVLNEKLVGEWVETNTSTPHNVQRLKFGRDFYLNRFSLKNNGDTISIWPQGYYTLDEDFVYLFGEPYPYRLESNVLFIEFGFDYHDQYKRK